MGGIESVIWVCSCAKARKKNKGISFFISINFVVYRINYRLKRNIKTAFANAYGVFVVISIYEVDRKST